jgi:hypothetical protein
MNASLSLPSREWAEEPKNENQKNLIPASYIFSFWIFIWAVAYIFVKYAHILSNTKLPKQVEWFNPALILLVALIWNTESLIKLILDGSPFYTIVKYGLMIVFVKAIPLWFVWTWDIDLIRDVSIGVGIFAVYCIYLWLNGTDLFTVYEDINESIQNDEDRTPFEHWIGLFPH